MDPLSTEQESLGDLISDIDRGEPRTIGQSLSDANFSSNQIDLAVGACGHRMYWTSHCIHGCVCPPRGKGPMSGIRICACTHVHLWDWRKASVRAIRPAATLQLHRRRAYVSTSAAYSPIRTSSRPKPKGPLWIRPSIRSLLISTNMAHSAVPAIGTAPERAMTLRVQKTI